MTLFRGYLRGSPWSGLTVYTERSIILAINDQKVDPLTGTSCAQDSFYVIDRNLPGFDPVVKIVDATV